MHPNCIMASVMASDIVDGYPLINFVRNHVRFAVVLLVRLPFCVWYIAIVLRGSGLLLFLAKFSIYIYRLCSSIASHMYADSHSAIYIIFIWALSTNAIINLIPIWF